jgi:hypothetical protein
MVARGHRSGVAHWWTTGDRTRAISWNSKM